MAAQNADGMIVCMGFRPENIEFVRQNIEEACAEVDRDPAELHLWWQTTVNFGDTVEEAMERSLGVNTSWMTMRSMDGKQIREELRVPPVALQADVVGPAVAMDDAVPALLEHRKHDIVVPAGAEVGATAMG